MLKCKTINLHNNNIFLNPYSIPTLKIHRITSLCGSFVGTSAFLVFGATGVTILRKVRLFSNFYTCERIKFWLNSVVSNLLRLRKTTA